MGVQDNMHNGTKRKMVIFFLLDTSSSMGYDGKIESLNASMREALDIARDLDVGNTDVQIQVAVMTFGGGYNGEECVWLTPEPEPVDRFEWTDVTAHGLTPLSKALSMLNSALSRNEMLDTPSASGLPAFVLMSDGYPETHCGSDTGVDDAIETLKQNAWYVHGYKAAIAIGDDADESVLSDFTGSQNTVFNCHSTSGLKRVLKFVIATSSLINSTVIKKSNIENTGKTNSAQEQFIEEAGKEKEIEEKEEDFNSSGWTF